MDTQPQPLDLAYRLPRHTYWQIGHNRITPSMPPPVDNTPEALAHRDNAAIAKVASMLPANANEAALAEQFVLASAHASHCLRLAMVHPASIAEGLHCRSLSVSMMRQAQGSRRLLMRVQAERRKLEADAAASERAAWTEHSVIGLMTDAMFDAPADAKPPPQREPAAPEPAKQPDIDPMTSPEAYAARYPEHARRVDPQRGPMDAPPGGRAATPKAPEKVSAGPARK